MIQVEVGTLSQLSGKHVSTYRFETGVEVIQLEGSKLNENGLPDVSVPLRVDAFHIILTLAGSARMEVNGEEYELQPNTVMNLIGVKVLRNVIFSDSYRGYHLMVSKLFYDEAFREGKHLTPETAMYKTHFPYDTLLPEESLLLEDCLQHTIRTIKRTGHFWHRRMVEATVRIFFMEMGHILITKTPLTEDRSLPNCDLLFGRFMQLLRDNGHERHSVRFYADKLCLSPGYLAQAIRAFSKKPISYWINETLLMQAKTYLADRNLPIQQIVVRMNFADQSSFGRFFRNNTGQTPAQYRRELQ
ncbi:MAG: helix-turn-helix domain-containing protein [Alloprevotella sp.]